MLGEELYVPLGLLAQISLMSLDNSFNLCYPSNPPLSEEGCSGTEEDARPEDVLLPERGVHQLRQSRAGQSDHRCRSVWEAPGPTAELYGVWQVVLGATGYSPVQHEGR